MTDKLPIAHTMADLQRMEFKPITEGERLEFARWAKKGTNYWRRRRKARAALRAALELAAEVYIPEDLEREFKRIMAEVFKP